MIEIVVFNLIGVVLEERNIELTEIEEKLKSLINLNLNDSDFLTEARKYIDKDSIMMWTIEKLIKKLYVVKEKDIFKNIKNQHPNLKIILATNHISYIRDYIGEHLDIEYLDDIIIGTDLIQTKPIKDLFTYILNKYNIKENQLLFIDNNLETIETAKNMGIKIISLDKEINLLDSVLRKLVKDNE